MDYYCPGHFTSTYQAHFKTPPPGVYDVPKCQTKQTDETLLSGHFANNLQVNGRQPKTQVWPKSTVSVEEYNDFLKRLECCKTELHKLYYGEECIRAGAIEQMLRDLEKTTYQYSFSPHQYVSKHGKDKDIRDGSMPTGCEYQPTTYHTYYSRLKEFERFKDLMYSQIVSKEKKRNISEFRTRKMFRTGRTTYWSDICFPAIVKEREQTVREVPLDRYTNRKI